MKKIIDKIREIFSTFSLTVLLTLNLFFMLFILLAVVTVSVMLGLDNGFLIYEGQITIKGGLVIIYAACILIAISIVFMIRRVLINPIRRTMDAMNQLAKGNFDVRIDTNPGKYVPREIREFAESFNKAAEDLSGTEILRKNFVSNFSHEFKTPIVSINGFADLLLEEELPKEDRDEYLKIIRDESKRLSDLSMNILTLNRIESQSILRDKETFRLDEQIRQCVLVSEQKWKEKELDYQIELQEISYTGNEALLKEVWLNILDNAAKFSPEKETITVILWQKENEISVSITDHGPGMDEKTKTHMFEQFYQGDTSHKSQGNGLGLAMVNKIVQLHEGTITVDTAPTRGCSFTITFKNPN